MTWTKIVELTKFEACRKGCASLISIRQSFPRWGVFRRIRNTLLAACFGTCLGLGIITSNAHCQSLPNPGQTRWWIVPLPAPCNCSTRTPTFASSLNDCGEVVGLTGSDPSYCPNLAWVWTICETLTPIVALTAHDLGTLADPASGLEFPALGLAAVINGDAVVGGSIRYDTSDVSAPFWWDLRLAETSSGCDIPDCLCVTAPSGFIAPDAGVVTAISDDDDPIFAGTFGSLGSAADPAHAWTSTLSSPTSFVDLLGLPNPSGGSFESEARSAHTLISGVQIAGFSKGAQQGATGADDAVLWQISEPTIPVPLTEPIQGGVPQWAETAFAGNSSGDLVGSTSVARSFGARTGVWWTPNGEYADVGSLFEQSESQVRSISERDQVGDAIACGDNALVNDVAQSHAYVWWTKWSPRFPVAQGTAFHGADFNSSNVRVTFAPGSGSTPFGIPKLAELRDINSRGWMVGVTTVSSHPDHRAVLVLPAPCQADLTDDGFVDAADLAMLLGAWGTCVGGLSGYCTGDLDDDGAISAADLSLLLSAWTGSDPVPCSLASVCATLGCRGEAKTEREVAPEVLAAIEPYGCACCHDFACFLDSLCEETKMAVITEVRCFLEGGQQ